MKASWPTVRLGEVLRHRKEFVLIDDPVEYARPRVRLHAQGIVLRDRVPGALIKTKRQQVCRPGELLVAEIDAKAGGFGIVPTELEGSIVSSHYFLYQVLDSRLDVRFLDFYVRTSGFMEQVQAQGTTNYAAIRPSDVLNYDIPLPPIAEQRRIVARIEELAAHIAEARALREQAAEQQETLVISTHLKLAGSRTRELGDILHLDEDKTPVAPDGSYPQVGVRSFGGGLFPKSAVAGNETTYKAFNRLYEGALLLSQVKGWEGAVAVCPKALAGWFVSPEYRTFRCVPSEVRPGYMAALIRTEWFWGRLAKATRGVGARRERTRPEQFLSIEIPMPSVEQQAVAEQVFAGLDAIKDLRTETSVALDALMPAILDRAFKGDL